MKKHYISKQIHSLLLILIFITSCKMQDKAHLTKDSVSEQKKVPAGQQEISTPVEDPSFISARDTVSKQGPRSITRNVLQDKNGNYWLATWEGIIRYDGKLFTNITLKEGLRHFHVFSILEDKTGKLWFGTIGGGLYRYDPSASTGTNGKSFTLYTTADGLAGNVVLCMLEDKTGKIWIGTDEGASRYDPSVSLRTGGKTFTNYTMKDGLSGNFINSIEQDKTGKLWFGTRGGVSCGYYPLDSQSTNGKIFTNFTNEKGLSFLRVRYILEDKTGIIWIGGQEGLYRYDPSASLRTGGKSLTNFAAIFTSYIFEDKSGNIWLSEDEVNGNGMTLSRYDGKSFTKIKSDNQIFGITEDKKGDIWFGTVNGVCRYDPSASLRTGEKSFTYFSEELK